MNYLWRLFYTLNIFCGYYVTFLNFFDFCVPRKKFFLLESEENEDHVQCFKFL